MSNIVPMPDRSALDRVAATLRHYVVFQSQEQSDACALWVAHTYAIDSFESTPYLHITSPEKRSGKTRLFEVLELLVYNPWRATALSEAVMFRMIDKERPTLLFDEVDAIFSKNAKQYEGLRGLLNAGHRRGTVVPRCVGEGAKMEVKNFQVFCAKALAGIGNVPPTVADRAIRIQMSRKPPTETVPRFRQRQARAVTEELRNALASWVESLGSLADATPALPDELDDRAQDGWEPLLAIADAAGPDWAKRARRAAIALSAIRDDEDDSFGLRLLADIRTCFNDAECIQTANLLAALIEIEDAPYGGWWGRDVDAQDTRGPGYRLAKALKPYGIRSRDLRFGTQIRKGYVRTDFEDVWARYLPMPLADEETTQRSNIPGSAVAEIGRDGWVLDA